VFYHEVGEGMAGYKSDTRESDRKRGMAGHLKGSDIGNAGLVT
jgi:hypothetical protein